MPVRTGSIVELDVVVRRPTTAEALNQAFTAMAQDPAWAPIFGVLREEFASSRIVGDTHSSIVDLPLTQVMSDTFVSVAAWYDNEMGYASRLAETAAYLAERIR